MSVNEKEGKIRSLQILRAIAFLGIFLEHAGATIKWPKLGVSVFLVLSGFLMMYQGSGEYAIIRAKDCIQFSWSKIRKLYPLHLITMVLAMGIYCYARSVAGWTFDVVIGLLVKILLNVTLLQTWIPYSTICISLNGVAWYLSVTAFLYAIFPILKRFVNRHREGAMLWMISIIIVQVLSCIPFLSAFGNSHPVYIWFMYYFPVFRIGDFIVGCFLGSWYLNHNNSLSFTKSSLLECVMLVTTILLYIWAEQTHDSLFITALCNWTSIYIILACIWVYLFAIQKGALTKLLQRNHLEYIGNLSSYLFLIHFVITSFINMYCNLNQIVLSDVLLSIVVLSELVLSLILSQAYKNLSEKRKSDQVFG